VLPLSYAVDAMRTITTDASGTADVLADLAIVLAFAVAALAAGAATLRRRTP
jgi:ABC-2 type transport system permease protein